MWAVWKSKHMIKLAKFQTKSKLFAGLHLPYKEKNPNLQHQDNKVAIIGGGDIGFPLLFSGVILKTFDFKSALIVAFFITFSLVYLLAYSKKNKFYPAMPYLTTGCFIGYFVIKLI